MRRKHFCDTLGRGRTRPRRPLHNRYDRKSRNLYSPPVFYNPVGGPCRNFANGKTRLIGLPHSAESMTMLCRFDTIPECDRQTGGRTEMLYRYRASILLLLC